MNNEENLDCIAYSELSKAGRPAKVALSSVSLASKTLNRQPFRGFCRYNHRVGNSNFLRVNGFLYMWAAWSSNPGGLDRGHRSKMALGSGLGSRTRRCR